MIIYSYILWVTLHAVARVRIKPKKTHMFLCIIKQEEEGREAGPWRQRQMHLYTEGQVNKASRIHTEAHGYQFILVSPFPVQHRAQLCATPHSSRRMLLSLNSIVNSISEQPSLT